MSRVFSRVLLYVIRVLLGSGLHAMPVPSAHLSRDVLGALRLELEVEVFILPDRLGVVHGFILRLFEVSELVAVQIAPLFSDIRKDKGTLFFAVGTGVLAVHKLMLNKFFIFNKTACNRTMDIF